ncbi:MAG: hypothetical protein U0792_02795 [Gemmataceae bacterium]
MNTAIDARMGRSACLAPEELQQRIAALADAGPAAIEARLCELEREWTAGRVTKAVIGVLIVAGIALAALANRWWLLPTGIAGSLLLQYLVTRHSWLGKLFHRMGFRTGFEVEQERTALKVIRGDFRNLPTFLEIENQEDISRLEGEGGIALDPETAKVAPLEAAKSAIDATQS